MVNGLLGVIAGAVKKGLAEDGLLSACGAGETCEAPGIASTCCDVAMPNGDG